MTTILVGWLRCLFDSDGPNKEGIWTAIWL